MNDVFQGLPREALHVLPHCGEGPAGSELFQLLLPIPRMKTSITSSQFCLRLCDQNPTFLHPYNERSLQYGIIQIKIHVLYVVCQDMLHINDNTTCIKTKQSQIYLGAELLTKI